MKVCCTTCYKKISIVINSHDRKLFYCNDCDNYYDFNPEVTTLLKEDIKIIYSDVNMNLRTRIINDYQNSRYNLFIYQNTNSLSNFIIKRLDLNEPLKIHNGVKEELLKKIKTYTIFE